MKKIFKKPKPEFNTDFIPNIDFIFNTEPEAE